MQKKWKWAAVLTLLVPIIFFLIFAIGEGSSGVGHYIQMTPILVLIILGWRWPRIVGYVLIFLGVFFAILYGAMARSAPLTTSALVELIVFIPVLCSGYFFVRASERVTR